MKTHAVPLNNVEEVRKKMKVAIKLQLPELPEGAEILIISDEHMEKGNSKCILDACIGDLTRNIDTYKREIVKVFTSECSMEELIRNIDELYGAYRKSDRIQKHGPKK